MFSPLHLFQLITSAQAAADTQISFGFEASGSMGFGCPTIPPSCPPPSEPCKPEPKKCKTSVLFGRDHCRPVDCWCPIDCFIRGCRDTTPCRPKEHQPYHQFQYFVVFLENIQIANPQAYLTSTVHREHYIKSVAHDAKDYSNFDANYPFFYALDAAQALQCNTFDVQFVNWFLSRLYYFLSRTIFLGASPEAQNCTGPCPVPRKTHCAKPIKEIDLLCLPPEWEFASFGDMSTVESLFNSVLVNSVLRSYFEKFINQLKCQIEKAAGGICSTGSSRNCGVAGAFTTFDLYRDLLLMNLNKMLQIMEKNRQIKRDYFLPKYLGTFAAVPYTFTPLAADVPNPTPLPRLGFVVIPASSLSIPKVIDFS